MSQTIAEPSPSDTQPSSPTTLELPSASASLGALIERRYTPLSETVEPFGQQGSGLFEFDDLLVRTNNDTPDLPIIGKDAAIYSRLAQVPTIPVPDVLTVDTSRELAPYDVLVMRRGTAVSAATIWGTLNPDQRATLSELAGQVVGAIHTLRWPFYGDFDPTSATFGSFHRWTDLVLTRLERSARQAITSAALPRRLIDAVVTIINDGDAILNTATPPILTHNNLKPATLLVDQRDGTWQVTALLDWSQAMTADAAWEFAALWLGRPGTQRLDDALIYGYRDRRPTQPDLRLRVQLYQLLLHLEGAVTAREQSTDDLRRAWHEQAIRRLVRG